MAGKQRRKKHKTKKRRNKRVQRALFSACPNNISNNSSGKDEVCHSLNESQSDEINSFSLICDSKSDNETLCSSFLRTDNFIGCQPNFVNEQKSLGLYSCHSVISEWIKTGTVKHVNSNFVLQYVLHM